MTQYQITLNEEQIKALFLEKNGLKNLVEPVLNQVLEAQVTEHIGAEHYERSDERKAYRNGYRHRKITTRIGTLTLRIPQIREGQLDFQMFQRYQRSEQAFVLSLMEMVLQGVSTRKVTAITEELCGASFSKSTVSELCKNLDSIVNTWRTRPLSSQSYPFVMVDALVIKVRQNGMVRPNSVLIAVGVNEDGHREILGFSIGDSESEATWNSLFLNLKNRGLSGIELVISDDHKGLVKAVQRYFQGVVWQRCQVHFIRNVLGHSPKKYMPAISSRLKEILEAKDKKTARNLAYELISEYEGRASDAMQCLENGLEDVIAILSFPKYYFRKLRSTNMVERLNEEIRRRERVIRIFPNEDSSIRLIGALLVEYDEKWISGRKYLNMEPLKMWKAESKQNNLKEESKIIAIN